MHPGAIGWDHFIIHFCEANLSEFPNNYPANIFVKNVLMFSCFTWKHLHLSTLNHD